ncbi:MAG: hypothetical protein ABJJ53_09810, partial [Sulfitobacter sp.]
MFEAWRFGWKRCLEMKLCGRFGRIFKRNEEKIRGLNLCDRHVNKGFGACLEGVGFGKDVFGGDFL